MRTAGLVTLFAIALWANSRGLPPRSDIRLHRAALTSDGFDLGATLLTQDQVSKTFASEVNRRFAIVEIGFYPKGNHDTELKRSDFSLRAIETDQVARAAEPLQKISQSRRMPVDVYPSATVGYETGSVYDPVTGRRRGGGWYSSTGVGVGAGTQGRPPAVNHDQDAIEDQMLDKELPEGGTPKAVAGYLYFPVTSKKKDTNYELIYDGATGTKRLNVGRR